MNTRSFDAGQLRADLGGGCGLQKIATAFPLCSVHLPSLGSPLVRMIWLASGSWYVPFSSISTIRSIA